MGTPTENTQGQELPLAYFEPGEIVLMVDHDDAAQADDPKTLLMQALENAGAGEEMMRLADNLRCEPANTFNPADEVILPLRNRSTRFSLIFAEVQEEYRGFREFVAMIDQFNQVAARIGPDFTRSATFRGASPNWLTTPFQDAAGGSPGARPRALNGAAGSEVGKFIIDSLPQEGSEDVEVVILDTAPDCRRLEKVINDQDLMRTNWLLGELAAMRRNDSFQIKYAGEYGIDLPLLNSTEPPELYKVQGHDYDMRDHGLFVAGIVHSIAPRARLRIIEVLNQRGIGTLQGVVRALQILLDERRHGAQMPLVINCSFGLTMPLAGHSIEDLEFWPLLAGGRPNNLEAWLLNGERPEGLTEEWQEWWNLMQRLRLDLASVCASLRGPNVRIVAAAGNDGDDMDDQALEELRAAGLDRPQARYPAALPGVIGVGAVDEQGNPLDYSNMSDDPTYDGYATFGGAAGAGAATGGAAAGEEGAAIAPENAGMLGAYIGQVPSEQGPNPTGWAWWAGTSFAAPIISAVLARFAAQGETMGAAEAALQGITGPVQNLGRVLRVTQNP